jgi:phosphomannomutase
MASGTENVIRIMAENENEEALNFVAEKLEMMIRKIDSRGGLCVE